MSLLEYEQYLYYPRSYFFAKKLLTGFLPGLAGVAMNRPGKTGHFEWSRIYGPHP
jgi:hypothetical protein